MTVSHPLLAYYITLAIPCMGTNLSTDSSIHIHQRAAATRGRIDVDKRKFIANCYKHGAVTGGTRT